MSLRDRGQPNFVGTSGKSGGYPAPALGGVNFRGVDEHDGDIVLNGVNPATDRAFQTLAIGVQEHRLLAHGADQDVEQILRDHRGMIVILL